MKNVSMEVKGNALVIRVDLTGDFGPSRTGKTTIVASTEGNQKVDGRAELVGLNVFRRRGE